ncbi:unnamed protein product [Prunus armeniaca]
MIPEDEKYEGKPFALSHARTAITTIKAKFNTQQLQRFEGSCFGHLLLIEDLKWNSQVVHGLLMRKADPKTVTQVNGIKFIVGNKLIQFTAQHFCLITGLRFGKLPFIPKATNENCSLKRKYFSSNKPPTLLDLHTAFIECTDDDDALKLGMVYFAIFVLLGTEKHVLIDMRYLKLAEDLEEFDKYPWGAVSYAMTNASLLRAVSPDYQRVKVPQNRKKPNKRGKKRAQTRMECSRAREYIIRGFGFALQIWAFEVFPTLEALHFTVHEEIGTSLEYYIGGATRWPEQGKGCRLKRPAKTLLSPFTNPSRKKRPTTGFLAQTPEARFDPTQPVAMDDVKAMIQVCKAWKSDISAELELEPFVVGADFFYKLVDETAWMSSRHLDMAMFLIRKRQLSHPQVFGMEWTTAEFCVQQFLQPFTPPSAKRVTRKQIASMTVDPPPNYLRNIHHFVCGSWQHGYAQAWTKVRKVYLPYNVRQSHCVAVEIDFVRHTATVYDSYTVFTSNTMLVRQMEPITQTLAKVLYDMRFYEKSEVEAVKRKGIDMSTFNPFTICRISDVPQQSDGTSCGIMTVKFIEYLSAGIPFNTIDPAKFGYYRLKLAIEALRGEAYGIGDFNTVDGNVHVLQLASDLSMEYVLNSDCVSSKTCIMLFMKGE